MTPAQRALREAAAAETARIYAATQREAEATAREQPAPWSNTAAEVAERRRIALSMHDTGRHLRSVS